MTSRRPRSIVILEGPDGGGKTTAAVKLAKRLNARLVHCGPFLGVKRGLARLYVEAMLPALLGYQSVVLDRAWPSEPIYAEHVRHKLPRLDHAARRMLDRIALRCGAVVVKCLPPIETCLASYRERRTTEYPPGEAALRAIHAAYRETEITQLPVIKLDRTKDTIDELKLPQVPPHPLDAISAGRLDARIVLVGETLSALRDRDPLFQAPFVAFDRAGCSAWLTDALDAAAIGEQDLLWLNADTPRLTELLKAYPRTTVCALGRVAHEALVKARVEHVLFTHPQAAKRFSGCRLYPLIDYIRGVCHER
jgi:thymidylate kinase